ncbi:hypothetical protein [Brevibacillus parabrevis]|uniref:hypothetical protein n=1 Tax=Brevibacillus parabrevis TaxID=54914 RepID=UPI000AB9B728|nr:hypothetical protein [Brevibacillus parabrevis]
MQLMHSINDGPWFTEQTLDANSTSVQVFMPLAASHKFKLVVVGGSKAGESNIVNHHAIP